MTTGNRIGRLLRGDEGVTAMEFVMVLPFLLFLLMGGIELSTYVLLHNKLGRVASTTADLTTRTPEVTEQDLQQILGASSTVALPYQLDVQGAVVISSVTANPDPDATPPVAVSWQRNIAGSGVDYDSQIGVEGQAANLPTGFSLRPTQNAIIVEIFYDYEPMWFGQVTGQQQIYYRAVKFPRNGALSAIQAPAT
ncbi:MAG: pilus assembly protein [Kiloniellales bacterium]|nr:pilus assembly protein [Kiloniellales bacterium]